MRRLVAIPVLALAGLAGCAMPAARSAVPTEPASTPAAKPACTTSVVLIWEDEETACDLTPPQRLDLRMSPNGDWIGRCDDMGGEPVELVDGQLRCEGVDY